MKGLVVWGFGVQGLGFRVLGFRVQDLGLEIGLATDPGEVPGSLACVVMPTQRGETFHLALRASAALATM